MKKEKIIDTKIISEKKKKSILSFTFGFAEEKEYFVENLSMLLASGMDIIEAMEAIKAEVKSSHLINIIDQLVEDINIGFSLWQALGKTNLLPPHIISLIKIGEESGRLHESLGVVVVQQAKNRSFKSKIRAAMMYPLFVMGVAMIVGIGIAWFILPRLATVFSQLNLKLPLVTRLLMGLGSFLARYGAVVVPTFIVVVSVIFYFLFFFQKTKFIGQAILFAIPGIKNLIREVELARFSYIMGTLLQAGLPVLEALGSLKDSSTLHAYGKIYSSLCSAVEEGKSFEEYFHSNRRMKKFIPTPVQSLIAVGERSGKLAKIFLNISENFEAKTELTTKNLSVILEPLLLVIVWLGVVAVALAVILPIYSLVGGLSNKQDVTGQSGSARITPPVISTVSTNNKLTTTSTLPITISTSSVIIIGPKGVPTSSIVSTTSVILPVSHNTFVQANGNLEVAESKLGYLNIRTATSSKSALIRKAFSGEKFNYIATQNSWYQVVLGANEFGWVNAQYIKVSSPTPTP